MQVDPIIITRNFETEELVFSCPIDNSHARRIVKNNIIVSRIEKNEYQVKYFAHCKDINNAPIKIINDVYNELYEKDLIY